MKLYNKQDNTTGKWIIIWFSIGLGALYWLVDCVTDVYIFDEGTLTSQIFSPHPQEIWMRLLTMFVLVSFGILAQLIININSVSEERIKDISSQWQTTFNAIYDAIFIADAEGKILRCNMAFAKLLNKRESEIIGRTCHDVVHGTEYFIDGCPFVAGKDTHRREVIELEAGNKWFSVTVDPVLDDSGEIISYVHSMSDISERKRILESLKESEEKYRLLFHNSPIGVFHYDTQLRITDCNNRFVDILQSSMEKLIGLDMGTLNDKSVLPAINEVLKGNEGFYDGLYKATTSQAEIWVSMHTASIFDRDGKVKGGVGIVEDITESKSAGEKLRISEERFRSLAENIDQVFWFTELNPERVLYVSPAFERIWGITAEELYGNPRLWVDLIHIDDRQHVQEAFEAFISSGGMTPYKVEYRIKKQDDEIRWIYDRGTFIPTTEGQPQRISGVAEDITERKQVQEALQRTIQTLQSLFHASPVAIIVLNVFGEVTMWSPAAEHIFGWKAEEALGRFNPIVPEEKKDEFKSHCERILSGESFAGIEVKRLRKDGSYIYVLLSTAPILDQNGSVTGIIGILADITEQKRAEEELRKSETNLKLYQTLIDQSNDSVEVLDPETGYFLNVNKRTCQDLGYSREELLSMKVFDIDPIAKPSDFQKIMEDLRRTEGGIWNGVHLRKDGSTFPVEVSLKLVQLDRSYLVAVARDITDRKRSEEALNERIHLLSFIAEVGTALTGMGDLKDILKSCAEALVRHLDAAFGRIWTLNERDNMLELQASAGMYTHIDGPHGRVPVGKFKIGLIAEERKPHLTNSVIEDSRVSDPEWAKKEGMVAFAGYPLMIDDRLVGVIAMFARHELTEAALDAMKSVSAQIAMGIERKKLEAWIFQIKQDWEDTFNIITDMITVHDADFNIIRYNRSAEKILGLSFLNVKREKCYQFYHGTTCPPAGCPSCMTFKTGVPSTVELFEPHLNMFIEIRAIPRFDSEHNLIGLIHVVRDITEHKKIESHLRQSQKMEAVGQLAGGVAHDFNNIITAIIGYASIMKMKAGQDDYLRGLIDNVLSASEKAANLVRSLLAFSRKQISNPEPVKINEIIKSIEKLLSMALGDDIELKIELTEDLIVTADIVQIEQVMMNLCTNARDAISGRGTLTIKTGAVELTRDFITAHGYGEEGRYALISVSDTGVGMDEDTRERIFEPFFTTKEVGKGTGLGLSIVYGIIKQHKGYIICQSEPGKGTTFNIYLPVVRAAMKEIERIEPSEPIVRKILFAEDEEESRKVTRQMLESSGYNVIEAVDGMDAVNKFNENNDIDLLLFDIIMPKMSGKEAYEKIRKIRPDVKALFISGYPADFTNKYGVFEEGMNFISKPVRPAELLRKIIEALGNEAGK